MLRQTPNRRHRWLAPANSDLESSYESRPGYHPVEVHTQAGPTQVSLHNQAVEALDTRCLTATATAIRRGVHVEWKLRRGMVVTHSQPKKCPQNPLPANENCI